MPSLLFTTIGRNTGRLHTVVLPYVVDGDTVVVIGSRGGGPHDPHWAHNIQANGHCWTRVNRRQVPAVAHVGSGEERERVFKLVCQKKPNVARYQERATTFGREIPVVVIKLQEPVRLSSRDDIHTRLAKLAPSRRGTTDIGTWSARNARSVCLSGYL